MLLRFMVCREAAQRVGIRGTLLPRTVLLKRYEHAAARSFHEIVATPARANDKRRVQAGRCVMHVALRAVPRMGLKLRPRPLPACCWWIFMSRICACLEGPGVQRSKPTRASMVW